MINKTVAGTAELEMYFRLHMNIGNGQEGVKL